jgi:hypothetical protein
VVNSTKKKWWTSGQFSTTEDKVSERERERTAADAFFTHLVRVNLARWLVAAAVPSRGSAEMKQR